MPVEALLGTSTRILHAPTVPVKLGHLHDPKTLLAVGGFLFTTTLLARRVKGALLLGIVATATTGIFLGFGEAPKAIVAMPFRGEYSLAPIAFQLDISGVLQWRLFPVLLTLFLLSFLDTLGTLVGVGAVGGMLDEKGNFREIERPMLVDALSCIFGSLVGTSTSGAYIESAAGIREGARTGLASLVTAGLFAATLFFIPLFQPLQHLSYAYGPALIAVGVLMLGSVTRIAFDDPTEAVPAFVTLALMVFTYNIGNGLTAGLLVYPVLKTLSGRAREVNAGAWLLGALSGAYYVFGVPH
jgi:AGZA family xanthine/uracil permease-like MFS transporter